MVLGVDLDMNPIELFDNASEVKGGEISRPAVSVFGGHLLFLKGCVGLQDGEGIGGSAFEHAARSDLFCQG